MREAGGKNCMARLWRVGMWQIALPLFVLLIVSTGAEAQTVTIRFRYQPQGTYTRVHFPGQFNGWGPNNGGTIVAGTPSQADSFEVSTGMWLKTVAISSGTWQYKIYRQLSANPSDWSWIPDPLNRVVIPPDQNSQFVVDSLVLFQMCAYPYTIESGTGGSKFVVKSSLPNLSAGIFQPAGSPLLDVSAFLDGSPILNSGSYYNVQTGIFTYKPSNAVPDGNHTFKVVASAGNQRKSDSVVFETRGRAVQIQTPAFTTHKTIYITGGIILKPDGSGLDSSVAAAMISVNGATRSIAVSNGNFSDSTSLVEGLNIIKVIMPTGVDSVKVTRIVNHTPTASISIQYVTTSTVHLTATGSLDPDNQPLQYKWLDDPTTPLGLSGITNASPVVNLPQSPGDYYFGLIATDPDGNADTTRWYFTVRDDGSFESPTMASNPGWARKARVYFLFPKAASLAGTLNGAAQRLQNIKDLGFNVIWLMPVMKNDFPIDQYHAPGYRITDFYNVAPEYGNNNDFKNFVTQAHALGLKVILDITPNHTSRSHPWSVDAHTNKTKSPYWNWYEHTIIPHNDNNLGQSLDADGFNYYSGFGDQLLNFNWRDIDGQAEMINVYRYWVKQFDVDGYRFDVYWGPHRRYGEQYMGNPVRAALKHIKPDILLLGEDDGTGSGTEAIYADYTSGGISSGLDAAYDFKLYFNQIRGFQFSASGVNSLHNEIDNGGYYPGRNALYMRFMESQDEDRIVYFYSSNFTLDATTTFMRTMPMASVVFTAPGFPMLWNGQEVGWGYGINGAKEARNRSTINWDYQGKGLLSPHYQKLANIRGQFQAFTQHKQDTNSDGQVNSSDIPDFVRVGSTNPIVYSFSRPYADQNGLTVVNFTGSELQATLDLTGANVLKFTGGIQAGTQYYLNNLYTNSRVQIPGSSLNSVQVSLPAYGTAIYTVSLTRDSVKIDNPILDVKSKESLPATFDLAQNYPNPFNPTTVVSYQLPVASDVRLAVFDVLGREVSVLVNERKAPGSYEVRFDGSNLASGVYFYRLSMAEAGGENKILMKKMMMLK
jgi:glycosidase